MSHRKMHSRISVFIDRLQHPGEWDGKRKRFVWIYSTVTKTRQPCPSYECSNKNTDINQTGERALKVFVRRRWDTLFYHPRYSNIGKNHHCFRSNQNLRRCSVPSSTIAKHCLLCSVQKEIYCFRFFFVHLLRMTSIALICWFRGSIPSSRSLIESVARQAETSARVLLFFFKGKRKVKPSTFSCLCVMRTEMSIKVISYGDNINNNIFLLCFRLIIPVEYENDFDWCTKQTYLRHCMVEQSPIWMKNEVWKSMIGLCGCWSEERRAKERHIAESEHMKKTPDVLASVRIIQWEIWSIDEYATDELSSIALNRHCVKQIENSEGAHMMRTTNRANVP